MDRRYRVLVVEDDPDVAEYLRTVLGRDDRLEVTMTSRPQHALELIGSTEFDVVLTDIEMPEMSGLELVGRLRSLVPDIPIAVITAHPSISYAVEALRAQADEFLLKPVRGAEIIATLVRLAELGQQRRAARRRDIVLVIGAHPDDVEIGVGGAMAAHRAVGDSVVILTLSRGAKGGDSDGREGESLAAAERIGARLFLEDLEDTRISGGSPTVDIIERVVAEIMPTIVYTHSAHDRHQDHRAVFEAASVATRRVPMLACFESPSATVDFRPNRFISIDGFTDAKLDLLACFRSQSAIRGYLAPDFVLATARYWSRYGGGTSCEPLEVIRDTRVAPGPGAGQPGALVTAAALPHRHNLGGRANA